MMTHGSPESFKQGMADADAGRFVDLDTALNEPYRVIRNWKIVPSL
jgi:hypothetical protein